ncbi:hypothetical protein N656DRAFT_20929 [Canariomyces notabilis]|uniref:Uncharacterized protein n=1 Tax=Canariomyces notabilis TaxID=2074819 RepID=A0AAN6YYA1_9PEZI|nr:hypothetical protein N656DRAFT_20929 [Canariomyces arenarius]
MSGQAIRRTGSKAAGDVVLLVVVDDVLMRCSSLIYWRDWDPRMPVTAAWLACSTSVQVLQPMKTAVLTPNDSTGNCDICRRAMLCCSIAAPDSRPRYGVGLRAGQWSLPEPRLFRLHGSGADAVASPLQLPDPRTEAPAILWGSSSPSGVGLWGESELSCAIVAA